MSVDPENLSKDKLKTELKKFGVVFNQYENKPYYVELYRAKVREQQSRRSEFSDDEEQVSRTPRGPRKVWFQLFSVALLALSSSAFPALQLFWCIYKKKKRLVKRRKKQDLSSWTKWRTWQIPLWEPCWSNMERLLVPLLQPPGTSTSRGWPCWWRNPFFQRVSLNVHSLVMAETKASVWGINVDELH